MPWARKDACIQCGTPVTETHISARGLCSDCGAENMEANMRQLHAKAGPAYNYWRKRKIAGELAFIAKLQAQIDASMRQ